MVCICREGGSFLSGVGIFVSVCSFFQFWSQYYCLHVCFLFFLLLIFLDSANNFVITLIICMKCVSGLFKSLKICNLFNQERAHQYIFTIHRKILIIFLTALIHLASKLIVDHWMKICYSTSTSQCTIEQFVSDVRLCFAKRF